MLGVETYLLFHQTNTPANTIISGNRNWLTLRTQASCPRVMVMRRSSCSFGRIEIKSSSEPSQSIVFKARSLLPLKLMKEFSAQDALPITTNRPCESCLPLLKVPAAAIVSGPFRFFGSVVLTSGELRLAVARLVSEESNSFWTEVLSPFLTSRERARGKPVAVPFIPLTMACES